MDTEDDQPPDAGRKNLQYGEEAPDEPRDETEIATRARDFVARDPASCRHRRWPGEVADATVDEQFAAVEAPRRTRHLSP
jgi:hypothetical protein